MQTNAIAKKPAAGSAGATAHARSNFFENQFDKQVKEKAAVKIADETGDWFAKKAYEDHTREEAGSKFASTCLVIYRLYEYMRYYASFDPFPANVYRANHMRNAIAERDNGKGDSFVAFINHYVQFAQVDIAVLHRGVCALFWNLQSSGIEVFPNLSFDTPEAYQLSLDMCVGYRVECDRLLKMLMCTMPNMFTFTTSTLPDGTPKQTAGVAMLPGYIFQMKDHTEFLNTKLGTFVGIFKMSVQYCTIAIEIERTFDSILRSRATWVKNQQRDQLASAAFKAAYANFRRVFIPFFAGSTTIARPSYHIIRLHRQITEVIETFGMILLIDRPGTDMLSFEGERDMSKTEIEQATKEKKQRTVFDRAAYVPLITKIARALFALKLSVHRQLLQRIKIVN